MCGCSVIFSISFRRKALQEGLFLVVCKCTDAHVGQEVQLQRFALLSVSDKRGIVDLAVALTDAGWGILSTGGTARLLREAGIEVVDVETYTGFPEMMDGRLKTLHPLVHGGILARRDDEGHMASLREHGMVPIDMVVCNPYPFEQAAANPDLAPDEVNEQIGVGGPSMLGGAIKNHRCVLTVVDPGDYAEVIEALENGTFDEINRGSWAAKAAFRLAEYRMANAVWLARQFGVR